MKKIILFILITFCISIVKAQNTAYGTGALANISLGRYNSAFGTNALLNTTNGDSNVGVGEFSLISNTIGSYNIGIGNLALNSNTIGTGNLAIGTWAMNNNVSGTENIAIGNSSGHSINTGSNNVLIGHDYSFSGLITGSSNTIIGTGISGLPSNLSNTIILADGNGNQRLYIDDNGNAGLGTTTPNTRLEINSNIPDASGLRFSQLNSSSATVATNGKALTVDASGNVVLTTAGGGTGGSFFTNATVGTNNIINTNAGAVIIGTGITSTPGTYKLYVSEGIMTEKVKVAVKNTGDWADYVFDEKYHLLDIATLDKYIAKNKHLPGLPSAKEVKEDGGFELGKTTVKLLEKIEELTLYVIQLKKEIDAIKLKEVPGK